jgi:hypothetical protein
MSSPPAVNSFLPPAIRTPISIGESDKVLREYAVIVPFDTAPSKKQLSLPLNLNGIKLLRLATVIKLSQ